MGWLLLSPQAPHHKPRTVQSHCNMPKHFAGKPMASVHHTTTVVTDVAAPTTVLADAPCSCPALTMCACDGSCKEPPCCLPHCALCCTAHCAPRCAVLWVCMLCSAHLWRSFRSVSKWASTVESLPPEAATATRSPGLKSALLTIVPCTSSSRHW